MQREQEALLELQGHVGQLLLGQLVATDRPVEHLAAAGVVQGHLQAVPGSAQRAEDDAETRLVQAGQRTTQGLYAGQHGIRWQTHSVQHELGGHRCPE